jgi:hypothetical protein
MTQRARDFITLMRQRLSLAAAGLFFGRYA